MNLINAVKNYFVEAYQELQRVIWPSRQETIRHTTMVVAISLAVAIFLGVLDYIFNTVLELFI